jgi:hypothetical protein
MKRILGIAVVLGLVGAFVVLAGMLTLNNGCAKNESESGKKSLVMDEYTSVRSISPEVADRVKSLEKYRDEIPKLIALRRRVIEVQTVVMLEDKVKGEDRGLTSEHIELGVRGIHALNELNEKLTKGLSDFAKLGADEAIVKCLESDVAEFKRNHP